MYRFRLDIPFNAENSLQAKEFGEKMAACMKKMLDEMNQAGFTDLQVNYLVSNDEDSKLRNYLILNENNHASTTKSQTVVGHH